MDKFTWCLVLVLLEATQTSAEVIQLKEFCMDPGASERCFSLYYDTDADTRFSLDARESWETVLQHCMSQGKRLAVLDDKTVLDSVHGNFTDVNHVDFRQSSNKEAWTALRFINNTEWEWLDDRKAEGITIVGNEDHVYAAMEVVSPTVSQLTFIAGDSKRASICLLPMGDCRTQQPGDRQHITASGVCLLYVNDVDYWKESTCQGRGGELAFLSQSVTKDDVSALLNKATDKRGWLGLKKMSVLQWGLPYGHYLPLSKESYYPQSTTFSSKKVHVLDLDSNSQWTWDYPFGISFRICEDVPGTRYTTVITQGSSAGTPIKHTVTAQTAATPAQTSRSSIVPGTRSAAPVTHGSSETKPIQRTGKAQTAATLAAASRSSIMAATFDTPLTTHAMKNRNIEGNNGTGFLSMEMRVIIGVVCFMLLAATLGVVFGVYQFKTIRNLKKRLNESSITRTPDNSDPAPIDPFSVDLDHSDAASLNSTFAKDSYEELLVRYVNIPDDQEGPNHPYAEIRVGN